MAAGVGELPRHLARLRSLEDIPGVGERMLENFAVIGVESPSDLVGRDATELRAAIGRVRGQPPTDALLFVLRKITHWVATGEDVDLSRFMPPA